MVDRSPMGGSHSATQRFEAVQPSALLVEQRLDARKLGGEQLNPTAQDRLDAIQHFELSRRIASGVVLLAQRAPLGLGFEECLHVGEAEADDFAQALDQLEAL